MGMGWNTIEENEMDRQQPNEILRENPVVMGDFPLAWSGRDQMAVTTSLRPREQLSPMRLRPTEFSRAEVVSLPGQLAWLRQQIKKNISDVIKGHSCLHFRGG